MSAAFLCGVLFQLLSFQQPVVTELPPSTILLGSSAAVDFNNDGELDVAFANGFLPITSGSFVVYNGDGRGTFTPGLRAPVVGTALVFPVSSVVGDFDGDGNSDVVIIDGSLDLIFVRGNGDGTFSTGTITESGFTPIFMRFARVFFLRAVDIDNDGKDEVLTGTGIIDYSAGFLYHPLKIWSLDSTEHFNLVDCFPIQWGSAAEAVPLKTTKGWAVLRGSMWMPSQSIVAAPKAFGLCFPSRFVLTATSYSASCLAITQQAGADIIFVGAEEGASEPCQVLILKSPYDYIFCSTNIYNPGYTYTGARFERLGSSLQECLVLTLSKPGETKIEIYSLSDGPAFHLEYEQVLPVATWAASGNDYDRTCVADVNHDGNLDILVYGNIDADFKIAALIQNAGFRWGSRRFGTGNQGIQLVATGGEPFLGNQDFKLSLLGASGGYVCWNLVRWNPPVEMLPMMFLGVPPRVVCPVQKNLLSLPVPLDPALLEYGKYSGLSVYFQWFDPVRGLSSQVLEVVPGPR